MGTRARQLVIVVAAVWLASPVPALADPVLSVSVLVQDHASVPPAILMKAEQVAAAAYLKIGVEISWYHSGADFDRAILPNPATREASLRSVLILSIVPAAGEAGLRLPPDVMGQAFRDSRYASVFYSRVTQLAEASMGDLDVVLGYVIAHEIGHLLLPNRGHSASGLMRARLDVHLMAQGLLEFDRTQAMSIRASLAARR